MDLYTSRHGIVLHLRPQDHLLKDNNILPLRREILVLNVSEPFLQKLLDPCINI